MPKNPTLKILMFVENHYPNDVRVRNEANTLVAAGHAVTVVALRKKNQPAFENVKGVLTYRVPTLELFDKTLQENANFLQKLIQKVKSLIGYVAEYAYFTSVCLLMSIYVAIKHGFDVIHAHNPPDTLWAVALPWKLLGKKYVFDHHDLCPELFLSRFGAKKAAMANILRAVEWVNLKIADFTIATNESYKQIAIARGNRKPESVFVVRNGPSEDRMHLGAPSPRLRAMNKTILVYIGCLNPQDGVDYLLRSLSHLLHDLKRDDFYCVIMGSGDSLNDLRALSTSLNLDSHVELTGYISEEDLKANLAAADICMDPDPSSPLNDVSTWIKIMEYMAAGKPIVTFDLKETRVSCDGAALFVPCNDEFKFAEATAQLMDQPALREELGRYGRERVESHLQWSVVSRNLIAAYAWLQRPAEPMSISAVPERPQI